MRRFRSPPPIQGPPEVYAYTDSDDEEEEKSDIAALREQLAALKLWLNNMDERVAESEIDRMDLDERGALRSPRSKGLDLDREDRINRLGVGAVLFLSFCFPSPAP